MGIPVHSDLTNGSSRRRFIQGTAAAAGGVAAHALGAPAAAAAQAPVRNSPGARLRALLARREPSRCVNCGDVATARLVEMHGFEIAMTGGSAMSLSQFGLGDYGMGTMDDLIGFCQRAARRSTFQSSPTRTTAAAIRSTSTARFSATSRRARRAS